MSRVPARRVGGLLLRFAVLYAALLAIALPTTLFAQLERPLVAGARALLAAGSESTTLRLEAEGSTWRYHLRLERDGEERRVVRDLHAHAYLLLLLVALVLATPGLSWRRRAGGVLVGCLASFGLGLGLLLSDVEAWAQVALPESSPTGGALGWLVRGFDALHRSSGIALLPLLLWLLYVSWADRSAREPPGSLPKSV